METSRKIPMEKLSKNAERIWNSLSHFPEGAAVIKLERNTGLHKSRVYEALQELESKGFVDHKKQSYIPKGIAKEITKETPPGRQLSKSERKRLEELVEARAEVKFVAQNYPSLQPLDDLLEIHKEKRKEAGLE
jgi:DNA-binding IclR family transcriptional regulator